MNLLIIHDGSETAAYLASITRMLYKKPYNDGVTYINIAGKTRAETEEAVNKAFSDEELNVDTTVVLGVPITKGINMDVVKDFNSLPFTELIWATQRKSRSGINDGINYVGRNEGNLIRRYVEKVNESKFFNTTEKLAVEQNEIINLMEGLYDNASELGYVRMFTLQQIERTFGFDRSVYLFSHKSIKELVGDNSYLIKTKLQEEQDYINRKLRSSIISRVNYGNEVKLVMTIEAEQHKKQLAKSMLTNSDIAIIIEGQGNNSYLMVRSKKVNALEFANKLNSDSYGDDEVAFMNVPLNDLSRVVSQTLQNITGV